LLKVLKSLPNAKWESENFQSYKSQSKYSSVILLSKNWLNPSKNSPIKSFLTKLDEALD